MITKNCGRQSILSAEVDFTCRYCLRTFAPALDIPAGAIVLSGVLVVKTAFNPAQVMCFLGRSGCN